MFWKIIAVLPLFFAASICYAQTEVVFSPSDTQTTIQKTLDNNVPFKKVVFSPGIYTKISTLNISPDKVSLVSTYGAKFILPANQGKFTRMFNILWNSSGESPHLVWEGGEFDLNEPLQNRVSYSKEHQAALFIHSETGVINISLKDIVVRNSAGDGISIYKNVVANIDNLRFRDCFRGGLTISGGYNKLNISNLDAEAGRFRTGLRIEPNNINEPSYYNISKFNGSHFNLQLGKNSAAIINDSVISPINPVATSEDFQVYLFSDQGKMVFHNCHFDLNRKMQIRLCGNTIFSDCGIRASQYNESDVLDYRFLIECWWNWTGTTDGNNNETLTMNNVEFSVNNNVQTESNVAAIRTYANRPYNTENNYILLDGCRFKQYNWYGIVALHSSAKSSKTRVIVRDCLLGELEYTR